MRLNQKYDPREYRLPVNNLYAYYQSIFFEIYNVSPELENAHRFKLESEESFYHNIFIQLNPLSDSNLSDNLLKYFSNNELYNLNIGKFDQDIIDFLLHPYLNELLLLGDVGWGKTTNLKRFFFFIAKQSKDLSNTIIPTYIDFNHFINFLSPDKNNVELESTFYNSILLPAIKQNIFSIFDVDNDSFWNYISSKEEYLDLAILEKNISKVFRDSEVIQKKIFEARLKYIDKPTLPLVALEYIKSTRNQIPIIIFDNVDPLPSKISSWLLWEIQRISEVHNIKSILSLRPNTYWSLFQAKNSIHKSIYPIRLNLHPPDLSLFIKKKSDYMFEQMNRANLGVKLKIGDIDINAKQAFQMWKSLFNNLLDSEITDLLKATSQSDLRKLMRIIISILQSDYLSTSIDVLAEIEDRNQKQSFKQAIYKSIITNNHSMFFSDLNKYYEFNNVLNIHYYNSSSTLRYLAQLHFLNFISTKESFTVFEIISNYNELFKKDRLDENDIKNILLRFNNMGLIGSPKYSVISSYTEISDEDIFQPLHPVTYYKNSLLFRFEYLFYVKDDIDFKDYQVNVRSVLDVNNFTEGLYNVINYIKFLFEIETEIFNSTFDFNNLPSFLKNFAPKSDVLFVSKIILDKYKKLVESSKSEKIINQYYSLSKEIDAMNTILLMEK